MMVMRGTNLHLISVLLKKGNGFVRFAVKIFFKNLEVSNVTGVLRGVISNVLA